MNRLNSVEPLRRTLPYNFFPQAILPHAALRVLALLWMRPPLSLRPLYMPRCKRDLLPPETHCLFTNRTPAFVRLFRKLRLRVQLYCAPYGALCGAKIAP